MDVYLFPTLKRGEGGLPFMMGEGRIHTKGKKVGHCRVSQRLLSMIVALNSSLIVVNYNPSNIIARARLV